MLLHINISKIIGYYKYNVDVLKGLIYSVNQININIVPYNNGVTFQNIYLLLRFYTLFKNNNFLQ